jgi:large subunit ribosomal protein L10
MSKTMKQAIMRDYKGRIAGESGVFPDAMLISIRTLKARDTTAVRNTLAKKQIKVTVVRNSLARKTFEGSGLAALADLLTGPSAVAYGGQSVVEVAREIVSLVEKFPAIELKGAVLDGQLFSGKQGCEELSRFPTKDEAIGRVVTLVVSPAQKLLGAIKGPGSTVVGLIKAIEGKLEKGETIAKQAG